MQDLRQCGEPQSPSWADPAGHACPLCQCMHQPAGRRSLQVCTAAHTAYHLKCVDVTIVVRFVSRGHGA